MAFCDRFLAQVVGQVARKTLGLEGAATCTEMSLDTDFGGGGARSTPLTKSEC